MAKLLVGAALVPIAFMALFFLLFAGGPVVTATSQSCTENTTATGKVSAAQLAAAALAAGVRNGDGTSPDAAGNTLTIVVALAVPESGADPSAVQKGQPYNLTGWGAWQITPGDSEPQCGVDQQLLDLMANACAMAATLKSQGLRAWTTFDKGVYKPYLGWAEQGVNSMSTAGLSCQPVQTSSASVDAAAAASGQTVVEATPPGLPSSFNSYPWGQCTYWVALHFPVPPYLGNADQWWANAAAHGMPETQTATAGSVVVYGAGHGYSGDGHVAYVVQVNPDGTFVVSEMNYVGLGVVDQRTSTTADVDGFIT